MAHMRMNGIVIVLQVAGVVHVLDVLGDLPQWTMVDTGWGSEGHKAREGRCIGPSSPCNRNPYPSLFSSVSFPFHHMVSLSCLRFCFVSTRLLFSLRLPPVSDPGV